MLSANRAVARSSRPLAITVLCSFSQNIHLIIRPEPRLRPIPRPSLKSPGFSALSPASSPRPRLLHDQSAAQHLHHELRTDPRSDESWSGNQLLRSLLVLDFKWLTRAFLSPSVPGTRARSRVLLPSSAAPELSERIWVKRQPRSLARSWYSETFAASFPFHQELKESFSIFLLDLSIPPKYNG